MVYECDASTLSEETRKATRASRNLIFSEVDADSLAEEGNEWMNLLRTKTEREFMKQIVKGNCSFLVLVMRKRGIEYRLVTGKEDGKGVDEDENRNSQMDW